MLISTFHSYQIMSNTTKSIMISIILIVSIMNPIFSNSENLKPNSYFSNTITSDFTNNSTVELGPWNFTDNPQRAYIHNWSSGDGFILIGYDGTGTNGIRLHIIFNDNTSHTSIFSLSGTWAYDMNSLFVDENGQILLMKRTSDSTCTNRYGQVTIDESLTIISTDNTVGNGDCGSQTARRIVNDVDIVHQSWQSSQWPATGNKGKSISIGNYSFSDSVPSHMSSSNPVSCNWNTIVVHNESLAFVQCGQNLKAINPYTGAEIWSTQASNPIQYFENEDAILTVNDGVLHANNGTRDDSLINYNYSMLTNGNYQAISNHPESEYWIYTAWAANAESPSSKIIISDKNTGNNTIVINGSLVGPFANQVSYVLLDPITDNVSVVTFDRDSDGMIDYPFAIPGDYCVNTLNYSTDLDQDGCDDLTEDLDDDNDGYNDTEDDFPNDSSEWSDYDNDGIGNNADYDDDNDGYNDTDDDFPLNSSEWNDFDLDGWGDNSDAFPLDSSEWNDTDLDGIGDNSDTDDDNDGWTDSDENSCGSDPYTYSNMPLDTDNDHICDIFDADDDNDGFTDNLDPWPLNPCAGEDTDSDGMPDDYLSLIHI